MHSLKRFTPEDDISDLYRFMFDRHPSVRMPEQPTIYSEDRFADWLVRQLNGYYHDLCLIYDDQKMSGYLLCFDYRAYDGHCQVYGFWDSPADSEPLREFVEWICSEYPLRKVFLQVTDKDYDLMRSAKTTGFSEEACLKEYKYIDGRYVDMHVMSYRTGISADGR